MTEQRHTGPAGTASPRPTWRSTALALAVLALAGCQPRPPAAAPAEVVRPALLHVVGAGDDSAKLRFPGRLRAAKRAELSFNVPGFVAEFALAEGSRVRAGQVLARLDDAVFRARVNAAQSEFDRARIDLERYQRLFDNEQAVSKAEVDDRRSRLESARTSLAAAQQDLADTLIKAPFAGVITKRRLETFASVQAKQAIAELQDLSSLEVVIQVPQRLVRNQGARAQAQAFFEEREDLPVPVVVTSYSSEADPVTQTYEVVLALQARPAGLTLLPGMSVTVLPFERKPAAASTASATSSPSVTSPGTVLSIPLTAVATDATGGTFVWVVNKAGQVQRAPVALGDVRGGQIALRSGLNGGERIVAAGVGALREGMKVRPLDAR